MPRDEMHPDLLRRWHDDKSQLKLHLEQITRWMCAYPHESLFPGIKIKQKHGDLDFFGGVPKKSHS